MSTTTVDGLTLSMLQSVAARAVADHRSTRVPDDPCDVDSVADALHRSYDGLLSRHAVTIHSVTSPSAKELAADRVSCAHESGEAFWYGGMSWRVHDWCGPYGSPRARALTSTSPEYVFDAIEEGSLQVFDVATIARQLGAAPDPYVAIVEVGYDVAGHRALYGVRRSGAADCWQD